MSSHINPDEIGRAESAMERFLNAGWFVLGRMRQQTLDELSRAQEQVRPRICLSCGAKTDPYGNLPCGH